MWGGWRQVYFFGYDGNWGVYPLLGLGRVVASDLDGGLFVLDASGLVPAPVPALGPGAQLLLMGMLVATATRGCRRYNWTALTLQR